MPKKILIVEDEPAIHELVKYNLQKEGNSTVFEGEMYIPERIKFSRPNLLFKPFKFTNKRVKNPFYEIKISTI